MLLFRLQGNIAPAAMGRGSFLYLLGRGNAGVLDAAFIGHPTWPRVTACAATNGQGGLHRRIANGAGSRAELRPFRRAIAFEIRSENKGLGFTGWENS